MADHLWFTDDPAACALLAEDPFALLVGLAIDQQVPVQKAFAGPYVLKQRVGTLEPKKLAALDLEPAFREKLEYGGDASRIWVDAKDTDDLKRRIGELPGFGPMKVTALGAILAHRLGVKKAAPLAPDFPCLGDVDSPQALADYQAAKRAHKAAMRAVNTR